MTTVKKEIVRDTPGQSKQVMVRLGKLFPFIITNFCSKVQRFGSPKRDRSNVFFDAVKRIENLANMLGVIVIMFVGVVCNDREERGTGPGKTM